MILARVKGRVVSTCKQEKFNSKKLIMVQPIDPYGKEIGDDLIAVDNIGAGADETVLIIKEGAAAAQLMNDPQMPLQAVIVAVVDSVKMDEEKNDLINRGGKK